MGVRSVGVVALVVLSGVALAGPAGVLTEAAALSRTHPRSQAPSPSPTPSPTASSTASPNPCVGTMRTPANGTTVLSIQGWPHDGNRGRPRLVGVGPAGMVEWVYRPEGATWAYDVDPIGDGRLFGIATLRKGGEPYTRFFVLDTRSRSVVWTETLAIADTHDADPLGPHRILIANMRAFQDGASHDRIAVYNRTSGEFVWSWYFRNHYPASTDEGIAADEDWTHLNDIDRIGPGRYLASPRNFDQVIVVDRSTGRIDLRLGRDGRHRVLYEQHNPSYLRGEDGRPTILVADSENDRVVEYARTALGWERTWRLRSPRWVRDADRLPDGNTLVAASEGNRVMEVTPNGTVVWEVYAPWLVYDAERVAYGDEAGGPTIAEQDAAGTVRLSGDSEPSVDRLEACARFLRSVDSNWTRPAAGTATPSATSRSPTPDGGHTDARSPTTGAGTPTATATTAATGDGEPDPALPFGPPLGLAVALVVAFVVLAFAWVTFAGRGRERRAE